MTLCLVVYLVKSKAPPLAWYFTKSDETFEAYSAPAKNSSMFLYCDESASTTPLFPFKMMSSQRFPAPLTKQRLLLYLIFLRHYNNVLKCHVVLMRYFVKIQQMNFYLILFSCNL
jgi:hypothetical protein